MDNPNQKIYVTFQEGFTENYIDGLKQVLGGESSDNLFEINQGPVRLRMTFHSVEGVEFNFAEFEAAKPIIIRRLPDKDPNLVHLNIIKEGNFSHQYNKELTQMQSGSLGGVFLYNGLFPIEAEFPAHTKVKWLGFKFNPKNMGFIFQDLAPLFQEMFPNDNALAYRSNLSNETEKLIADVFSFQDLTYGKNALLASRAIEIFTNKALNFKREIEADESLGLHADDYELLMRVKEKITSQIEQSYTIEELSKEFGVSTTKLKNDFKQLFGTTIHRFYNQARMDEAYRRLKSGQFSVSEVGYDMGYSSLSKFSEMFKKTKGLLPTEVVKAK